MAAHSACGLPTDGELIDALGGTSAVAARLRISKASVSEMRRNGIPDARKIELGAEIEAATDRRFARWHLRPLDWHRIWPELIGADGAPNPPVAAEQGA